MYPSIPIASLAHGTIARTGFSFATFLIVATILIVSGLLMVRTARVLGTDAEG